MTTTIPRWEPSRPPRCRPDRRVTRSGQTISSSIALATCTGVRIPSRRQDLGSRPEGDLGLGTAKNGPVDRAEKKRALYPGGRPTPEAKAIHRRFAAGPLPRVLPIASLLEVRGRRSGQTIRIPLAIVRYRRSWYLVSMFGEQSNWVKNVRASDGEAVLTHGRRRPVRLVEVPFPDRAPIIKRYLLFATGARPHMQVGWGAPLSAFKAVAASYPVFRVEHR
ncbi:MAG: nitroreductase/quinone reductase family protein [Acidimicrobiales bacterium]|jgi:deazaflavin-dependent oxidoreductase (nitroreductase family)